MYLFAVHKVSKAVRFVKISEAFFWYGNKLFTFTVYSMLLMNQISLFKENNYDVTELHK